VVPHRVVLYSAERCHLCERARAVIEQVRAEVPFELEEIDIGGDPNLEAAYREWLPVVEIDGARAFVYHVDPRTFRRKLLAQTPGCSNRRAALAEADTTPRAVTS
jgi:glutaredoxin